MPGTPRRLIALVLFGSVLWAQSSTDQAGASRNSAHEELPNPAGKYRIGRHAVDLVDNLPPASATRAEQRELMLYIWYPAKPGSSMSSGEYFPFAAEIDKDPRYRDTAREIFGPIWPKIVDGSVHSHAVTDAPPVIGEQFPVILFFPGHSSTTFSYTAQIENLVSFGYVVVAVEDTNGSGLVRFSDGRVGLLRSPAPPPSHSADPMQAMIASAKQGTQTGAERARFVLDALRKSTPLSRLMNLSKVAAVGHSAGGTLAARACQIDSRIKVCISEDGEVNPVGAFFAYPDHNSVEQPFSLIQVEHNPTSDELARMHESRAQWDEFLEHERWQLSKCGKGSLFIQVHSSGTGHSSFSDGPLLDAGNNQQAVRALENLRLTERLEKAFLDKYLKGVSTSIFDQHGATPEGVTIERVGKQSSQNRSGALKREVGDLGGAVEAER